MARSKRGEQSGSPNHTPSELKFHDIVWLISTMYTTPASEANCGSLYSCTDTSELVWLSTKVQPGGNSSHFLKQSILADLYAEIGRETTRPGVLRDSREIDTRSSSVLNLFLSEFFLISKIIFLFPIYRKLQMSNLR